MRNYSPNWLSRIGHEVNQLLRFTVVGLVATAMHLFIAIVAYRLLGFGVWSANLSGFLAALSLSYFGHYHFSFSSGRAHMTAMLRFATTALMAYLVNLGAVWLLTSGRVVPESVAMVIGIGLMPIVTFTLSRLWVY